MDAIIRRFLNYSFGPVGFDYDQLTDAERELCTRTEFVRLCAWVRGEGQDTSDPPKTQHSASQSEPGLSVDQAGNLNGCPTCALHDRYCS
jgi:hypothetical protein